MRWISDDRESAFALQAAPADGAVVANNLLEHGAQFGRLERFTLTHGHYGLLASSSVGATGYESKSIGGASPLVPL